MQAIHSVRFITVFRCLPLSGTSKNKLPHVKTIPIHFNPNTSFWKEIFYGFYKIFYLTKGNLCKSNQPLASSNPSAQKRHNRAAAKTAVSCRAQQCTAHHKNAKLPLPHQHGKDKQQGCRSKNKQNICRCLHNTSAAPPHRSAYIIHHTCRNSCRKKDRRLQQLQLRGVFHQPKSFDQNPPATMGSS